MFSYQIKKAQKVYDVDYASFTDEVRAAILEAGLGRILNDLVASAKTVAEAQGAVQKKLDAWANGVIRTSPTREGNPVKRRALELASASIAKHPAFIAAVGALKKTDKAYVAALRAQAEKQVAKPDNKFMAQAAIDVANAPTADDIELDL